MFSAVAFQKFGVLGWVPTVEISINIVRNLLPDGLLVGSGPIVFPMDAWSVEVFGTALASKLLKAGNWNDYVKDD